MMNLLKKYKYPVALSFLFLCAVFLRAYKLTQIPDVIELDEAGMGYNAWCLAHYGTDRYLNVHPFYAQNFEGGQSPLYTYLLVLLIRTLGLGNVSLSMLPVMLGFAGGAMLYVTSDEMIPETHAHGYQKQATYALLLGFITLLLMERWV